MTRFMTRSITRSLLALVVAAACIAPPTALAAQSTAPTAQDSAHAHAQRIPLDSIQRFVLPPFNQYCGTKGSPGYVRTACQILTRQLRSAWAGESLLVASAPVVVPPSAPPVDTTAKPATDTSVHVFASTDFESGTIAPFTNPYAAVLPGALDVVADPTNSGHGKKTADKWNQ